jgi:hypothetical protein
VAPTHEHRPEPHDPRIEHRLDEGRAALAGLLDEVEQHDDVTDDDPDQARHAQERHEAEGNSHHPQCQQRSHHPEGDRGEHEQRLHGVPELREQRDVDQRDRDQHDYAQLAEPSSCCPCSPPTSIR